MGSIKLKTPDNLPRKTYSIYLILGGNWMLSPDIEKGEDGLINFLNQTPLIKQTDQIFTDSQPVTKKWCEWSPRSWGIILQIRAGGRSFDAVKYPPALRKAWKNMKDTTTLDSWRGNETSHLNHFSICAGNMKVALVLRWYFESYFYIFQPIRSCMSWFFYTSIYLFNGLKQNSSNNWMEQSPKSTDITNAKRNRDLYIPFSQPYQRSQHFMARLAAVVFLTLDVAPCHRLLRSTAAQSPRQWLASSVRMPAASTIGMHQSSWEVVHACSQSHTFVCIHQLQLIKGKDPKISQTPRSSS